MKKIWHTREDFKAVALEDPTKFIFSFKSDLDQKKMMRRSPWTFDRSLLLLKAMDGRVDPMSLPGYSKFLGES